LIIDRANEHVNKLALITSGNTGYSLSRFAEGTNIKVVSVVDKNVSYNIRKQLEKYCQRVIEVDLSEKILRPEDVISMARESDNEVIWNVSNGFEKAYESIIREIKPHELDWLLVSVGGGEAFVGLHNELKRYGMKTRLVGVGVKGPSIADKLYAKWSPYTTKIEEILKEGHRLIRLSEEQVKDAYEKVKDIIPCEPSSSVVFGALPELDIDSKDKVIVINSGKGIV